MENPNILSHVSLGTNDFDRAVAFYDKVFAALGARRLLEHPGAVAYGKQFPELWVQTPIDGQRATLGNGTHFGFVAASRAAVEAGASGDGEPGARSHYGPQYYGCFVRDLDGHKIEATFWDLSKG